MSAYHRPQRENLSLKTMDIPGAMGKQVIPDRKLVYKEKEMPPNSGFYSKPREDANFGRETSQIDPYYLQEEIRHSE